MSELGPNLASKYSVCPACSGRFLKNLQCFPVPDYSIGNERMIFALRDYTEEMQIRTNEVLASEAMNHIYSLVAFRDIEANKYECIHRSENIHEFKEKGSYEVLVQEMLSVIHEEDREKYLRELSDERFERDACAECEFRMRDMEGFYHYYHEYITKVKVPSGSRMVILIKNIDEAIDLAVKAEHGNRHTAHMHSKNVDNLTKFARAVETTIFVKNGPSYAGIGAGGEGHTTFTIAGPTGEGLTAAHSFTRQRRCVMVDGLHII